VPDVSGSFVNVYRYRLRADAVHRCLEAWRSAHAIYARHLPGSSVVFFRSREDPSAWLEVATYPDENAYRRAFPAVNADPELRALWAEIEAALAEPVVREEAFEEVLRLP
jgi:hypothetical protein